MKKCCLMVFALLLLLLCACVKQAPAGAAAERAENNTIPRSESQSAAAAEKQETQSEDPAQAAFTGGITLYADCRTAYVNSKPVEMPAAPFVENGNFYIPLQFVAETMGWSYQEQDGTVTLASSSHQTTLTVGMRTICIDDDRPAVNSYDWQFPEEDLESDPYVPLLRDKLVFIPLDFLETRTDRDLLSRLSFRTQWFPEEQYAILSIGGKEEGFCGFYLWDHYDDLPEAQRAGMEELGIVGFSRDAYDVVEYGANGLFVHVLRLRDGCEDMDRLDGVISSVYTTNPDIPTLRGLRVGEEISRIYTTYDGSFFMELLCLTEGDVITQIRFRCAYYDDDARIRVQPTCLHMDVAAAAGQDDTPPLKDPAQENAGSEEIPSADIPVEESVASAAITDKELLDLVLGSEIALTGQNSFTFHDPTELSSQELYMLFLHFSDYETLVKDCEDEDSGEFTFTREYISSVLSKCFKDYTLDLTQVYDYDSEQDAAVTTQVSGFGGCLNPKLVEKEWDGSTVTFTVDYYAFEDVAQTGTPYMRKSYQVEFYDGGVYYLSAIQK